LNNLTSVAGSVSIRYNSSLQKAIDFIELHPNLTSDILKIDAKDYQIEAINIYNVNGEKIKSISNLGNKPNPTIDISELQSGQYLLLLEIDGQTYQKKIIKL